MKPYKNPQDLAPVTFLTAQAVINAVQKAGKLPAEIKLPNDVLIQGKKVCGILVERVVSGHLIIGIGVNVNNSLDSFPDELRGSATSLKAESGRECDLQQFIDFLLSELDKEYLAYLA